MSTTVHAILRHPDFIEVKRRVIDATGMIYFKDKDDSIVSAAQRAFKLGSHEPLEPTFARILRNDQQEFNALIDELTIGETFFFRHAEMFQALREQILPDIITQNSAHRMIRIWSAGCSIGAEPYSISILLHELLGSEAEQWKIEIVGSDINRKFLRTAVKGVFAPWALRGVSEETTLKYFDPHESNWRLKSVYRSGVHFRYYNLIADPEAISQDFYGLDLLICRNVMIYFDVATNRRLINAFHQCLRSDAWLLVGHAENHHDLYRQFRIVNAQGAVLYRKGPSASPVSYYDAPKLELKPFRPVSPSLPRSSDLKTISLPSPVAPLPKISEPPASTPTAPSFKSLEQSILEKCDAGCFLEALNLAEAELALNSKQSDLYYLRGMIHAQLGHWDRAKEDFKSRLFFKRDCVMTHYQLALLPQEQEQSQKHLRNADKILSSLSTSDIIPLSGGLREPEMRLILDHQRRKLSL